MQTRAEHLKAAVMSYFRFERQWIAATEVTYSDISGIADVLCDTGDEIIEVETKVDKSDLLDLELKKKKHEYFKTLQGEDDLVSKHVPNKFYICVPKNMERVARQFIEEINPAYGLILFDTRALKINARSVELVKHPRKLHEGYDKNVRDLLVNRLSSEVANFHLKKANDSFRHTEESKASPLGSRGYRRPRATTEEENFIEEETTVIE